MTSPTVPAGSTRPWYTATVSGLASYLDSATIVSSGAALVMYQEPLGITDAQIGVLSFTLTMGIAVGALVGGRLGDRFGRKPVFSVTMALIIIAMSINVFAGGFAALALAAALAGFATGADLPVSIATVAEAGTDENRGKLVGFSQVLWMLGVVVTLTIQSTTGDLGHLSGQILFGHVLVVAVITFLLRFTLPESQVWLDAQRERATGVHTERAERAKVKDLLKAPYLLPFVALMIFYPLVNLAANTGGQFGTYLWVNLAGSTPSFAGQMGLVNFGIGMVLSIAFLRIVDTKWRMPVFYIGAVAYVLSTLIAAVVGVSVTTLVLWQILGAIGGAFAFEAILKVWTQESFPTLLRSTAQGTIIAFARFLAAILALVTPVLAKSGPTVLFGVLTALVLAGMIAAIVAFRKGTRNEFDIEFKEVDAIRQEKRYVV